MTILRISTALLTRRQPLPIVHHRVEEHPEGNSGGSISKDEAKRCFLQGSACIPMGDFPRAIELLTRAINANFNTACALMNRGIAHTAAGDPAAALRDFDDALALGYPNPELLCGNRANAHRDLGHYQEAIDDYTRAIKGISDSRVIGRLLLKRAEVYDRVGARDKAKADRKKASGLGFSGP